MNYLENEFFLLAITFGIYFFAKLLQKKTGILLLNPILLTIAVIIIFLKITNISFETYNQGGHLIEFWKRCKVMKNRVRVSTNMVRRFFFNSGQLQKNQEKVNEMDYFIYFCKMKNEYT